MAKPEKRGKLFALLREPEPVVGVMDVKLVMAKGRPREHTIQLRSEKTVIGRHRDCNLRIPSSDVSRQHCVLRFQSGCLHVEDLKSTNGTFVNGEPVKRSRLVRPGDELRVGPVSFTVEYRLPAQADAPLDVAPASEVEVLEEEEQAVIVIDDEADGELFNFETAPTDPKASTPPDQATTAKKPKDEAVVDVQFDLDQQPLQLPDDDSLRDILSRLDH